MKKLTSSCLTIMVLISLLSIGHVSDIIVQIKASGGGDLLIFAKLVGFLIIGLSFLAERWAMRLVDNVLFHVVRHLFYFAVLQNHDLFLAVIWSGVAIILIARKYLKVS